MYILVKAEFKYDPTENHTKVFLTALTNSKFKEFLEQIKYEIEQNGVPPNTEYTILKVENLR